MRTPIVVILVGLISFTISPCKADPADTPTERKSARESATSNGDEWTIKGQAFSKSRSLSAIEFGLTAGTDSDQSSALAKAIRQASESQNVDTVFVPAGVYFFSESIWLRAGVNLIGDGAGKTVFESKNDSDYLLKGKHSDYRKAIVANLTVRNRDKLVLMQDVRNLQFSQVEFSGGIVRFENSASLILDGNIFSDNRGKSAYASSECENVRIVNNAFNSVENGSINLSGHKNCYVAFNYITSPRPIYSGYAGIRLPNDAGNNIVEKNYIENHGRGIFILSSSGKNTVRNNVVKTTTQQGILIQSSNNLLEGNTIIDAGNEAVFVVDATAKSSPTPSIASGNRILGNVIYDTRKHDASRSFGLRISSRSNTIKGNKVSGEHGRIFKEIRAQAENQDLDNVYGPKVEKSDVHNWVRIRDRVKALVPGLK